jgi:hypothetical protein
MWVISIVNHRQMSSRFHCSDWWCMVVIFHYLVLQLCMHLEIVCADCGPQVQDYLNQSDKTMTWESIGLGQVEQSNQWGRVLRES